MLNAVPTTDLVENGHATFIENYYTYDFKNTVVPQDSSLVHSIEFGYRNVEFGYDKVADSDFENGCLYPSSFNFKWRLYAQDGTNPISLALGTCFAFGKTIPGLEGITYEPAPYIVAGRAFKNYRLTFGYQWNIAGSKRHYRIPHQCTFKRSWHSWCSGDTRVA